MQLREYQEAAISASMDALINGNGNPIVEVPTGGGKSIIIADTARRCKIKWNGIKILLLTHRAKLVQQDADKFQALGMWPSIFCSELGRKEVGQFTIGTILSVANEQKKNGTFNDFHLIMVDELQLINNEEEGIYREFLASVPNAKIIGYSATPYRLKGGACYGPGRIFDWVCYKVGFGYLVKQGYLTPPINYDAGWNDNFDDIKLVGGDFSQKDMNEHFNAIVQKSCADLVHRMADRHHCIVFACSIVHAEAIVACLKEMGEKAVVYHSKLDLVQDRMVINQFQARQFKYLVSIDKLSVGFDAPFVDGLGMMRPTMSRALAIQMLGRGCRLYPNKKDFLVADYAGNIRRHNLLNPDSYDVPYESIPKPQKTCRQPPMKTCPNCQLMVAPRVTVCECGYKFPPKIDERPDYNPDDVAELEVNIFDAHVENGVQKATGFNRAYVKLVVGTLFDSKYVHFFPEDNGYSKVKSCLLWHKLFGSQMPSTAALTALELNNMKNEDGTPIFTKAKFVKVGKYHELKELT